MAGSASNATGCRRAVAATTAAAALCSSLLAGCGGSPNASGSDGAGTPTTTAVVALPPDVPLRAACTLVTRAEVESAIGARVNAGTEAVQDGRSLCAFPLTAAADQSIVVQSISSSGVPAHFEATRQRFSSAQPVAAGDQAFVAGGQGVVRKGNTMVIIVIALRQATAPLVAAATKLAQAVSARL